MDVLIVAGIAIFVGFLVLIVIGSRHEDYPEDEIVVSDTYEEERVITTIKKEEVKEEEKKETPPSPWDRPWEKK